MRPATDITEGHPPQNYLRRLGHLLRRAVAAKDTEAQDLILERAEAVRGLLGEEQARRLHRPHPPRLVRPMPPSKRTKPARDRGVGVTRAPSSKRVPTMAARVRYSNLLTRKKL